MPDLATHALATYFIAIPFKKWKPNYIDYPHLLFGAILPDIITRPIFILFPETFDYVGLLHTPFSLFIICLLIATFFKNHERKKIFLNQYLGSVFHLFLDFFQIHLLPCNYLLFPFLFDAYGINLFGVNDSLKALPVLVVIFLVLKRDLFMLVKTWITDKFLLNFRYAFRIRKPLLTLRLIKVLFEVMILKRKPLRYVDFSIGYECNLNCEHCFAVALESKGNGRPKMDLKDYSRVVYESMKLGAVNFSFQGGEVFMVPGFAEIIKACKPHANLISLTTNGTFLIPENIKKIKRLGVDILTISLDSGIEAEHDSFRGRAGTFRKAMSGIDNALKSGLNVTIGATVSHQNLYSTGIKDLINFSKKKKIILVLILAVPAGKWSGNNGILITKEDMEFISSLTKSSPYIRTDFDANYLHRGCGAIKEILYVTPFGDVLPCPFLHISVGNVLKESVNEIRDRGLENKYFKGYYPKCLAAEDEKFINRYFPVIYSQPDLPVAFKKLFPE